jgi:hypothetical protein
VYLYNRQPHKELIKNDKGKEIWIWITPYKKLYSKKPLVANLYVYGCRAYITFYKEKILKLKKLDP